MDWLIAALLSLVGQMAAGAVLTALALLVAWARLIRLEARVRAGRITGRAAFHRFRVVRVFSALIVLLPLVLLALTTDTPPFASQPSLSLPLQVSVLSLSLLGSAALFSLLAARLLVPRAWTRLIGTPFDTRLFVTAIARTLLLAYTPLLVFVNLLCLCFLIGLPALRWLLPLAAAGWVLLTSMNSSRLRAWLTGAVPIERTAFADQAARIREWARLAGVELRAILVDAFADGNADNALVAGPREPTMFLGAELLAHTDWRQRDAVIGHELGHARMGHLLTNTLVAILRVLLFSMLVVGLLPAFQSFTDTSTNSVTESADPTSALIATLLGVAAPLLVIVGLLIISFLGRLDRRRRHRMELDCDRFSVALTGDPLAMAVLLHTITVLAGLPLRQRSQTHPTFNQRVEAMFQMLYQSGPRAPWAYQPVPSDIPFGTALASYTVPMDQAPAAPAVRRATIQPAPAPAPVAAPPYPVAYPPAPGYAPAPTYAYAAPFAAPAPASPYLYPYPYPYTYPYPRAHPYQYPYIPASAYPVPPPSAVPMPGHAHNGSPAYPLATPPEIQSDVPGTEMGTGASDQAREAF